MNIFNFFKSKQPTTYETVSTHEELTAVTSPADYLKCEKKAQLSRQEARDTLYIPSSQAQTSREGFHKIPTVFDEIRQAIVDEMQFRRKNTILSLDFRPENLASLLASLDQMDGHTDIKSLIRHHINQQELNAAQQSIGQLRLWHDIRCSLNEKIGFQPQLHRNEEASRLLIKRSSSPSDSAEFDMQLKDPHARERTEEQIKTYELAVSELIQNQLNPNQARDKGEPLPGLHQ